MAGPRDTLQGSIERKHFGSAELVPEGLLAQSEGIPDAIALRRPAFLANRWLDLAKMRDALAASDFATVQTIGHNCKGTGVGYGFPDISSLGSAIEAAARNLNSDKLQESLREFERYILAASASALQAD